MSASSCRFYRFYFAVLYTVLLLSAIVTAENWLGVFSREMKFLSVDNSFYGIPSCVHRCQFSYKSVMVIVFFVTGRNKEEKTGFC